MNLLKCSPALDQSNILMRITEFSGAGDMGSGIDLIACPSSALPATSNVHTDAKICRKGSY